MAQVKLNNIWASTGSTTDTGQTKYLDGWVVEIPTFQNFNYVLNGIDTNIHHIASIGAFEFQSDISYQVGAEVRTPITGVKRYATTDSTGSNLSSIYDWSSAPAYGRVGARYSTEGLILDTLAAKTSGSWGSQEMTISGSSSIVAFNVNTTRDNYLLANIDGDMVLVNTGNQYFPDGRDISVGSPGVYKIYHEGNPPSVGAGGGVLNNPQDGKFYLRQDSAWVEIEIDGGTY